MIFLSLKNDVNVLQKVISRKKLLQFHVKMGHYLSVIIDYFLYVVPKSGPQQHCKLMDLAVIILSQNNYRYHSPSSAYRYCIPKQNFERTSLFAFTPNIAVNEVLIFHKFPW
jgi:hypothetical protein